MESNIKFGTLVITLNGKRKLYPKKWFLIKLSFLPIQFFVKIDNGITPP
jgi:hypothetical protein